MSREIGLFDVLEPRQIRALFQLSLGPAKPVIVKDTFNRFLFLPDLGLRNEQLT